MASGNRKRKKRAAPPRPRPQPARGTPASGAPKPRPRPAPTPVATPVPPPAPIGRPAPRDLWWGVGVTTVTFFLYLSTTAHHVIAGDTPDFLIAAKTLGVAHAPGYPSLVLLGHLFSWLPIGSLPFRIDFLATVCGTATVTIVFATINRLIAQPVAAAGGALALAFTPLFWRWSLQMETFPLNNLLAALVVYLLGRWYQEPGRRGFVVAAAFVFGLGLTNQQTIALLVPAIIWVLWLNREFLRLRPSTIGWAVVTLLAGLLPYMYVPLAASGHSPTNWDYVDSFSNFMRLILRKDYGGLTLGPNGGSLGGGNFPVRILYLGAGAGFVLGLTILAGFVYAWRVARWYFWFVVLAFVVSGLVFVAATDLDPTNGVNLFVLERFFLLPLVTVAPLSGIGISGLAESLARRRRPLSIGQATAAVSALTVVVGLIVVGFSYSTLDVRSDNLAETYASDLVRQLPPHAILFATGDDTDLPLLYITTVAKVRPDVDVVLSPILDASWYQDILRHNHQLNVPAGADTLSLVQANPGRPVAFVGDPPDKSLTGKYYLYPDGLVFDLEPEATTLSVQQEIADNTMKEAHYHVPSVNHIKPDSFEIGILDEYAGIPFNIGTTYQEGGDRTDALTWFHKALAIDPHLAVAEQAIKKIQG